jgi:uncharacterized membrane protein YgcG
MEFLFILLGIYAVSLLAAWLGARLGRAAGGGPPPPRPVRPPPVAESRYAVKSIHPRRTPRPDPHPPSFHPRLLRPACIDNAADTTLVTPAYLRHSERAKSRPERNDSGPESLPGYRQMGVIDLEVGGVRVLEVGPRVWTFDEPSEPQVIDTSGESSDTFRDTEPAPPEPTRDTVVDFEPAGGSFGGAGAEGSWGSNDD